MPSDVGGSAPDVFCNAALAYAARGWAVFPLVPGTKDPFEGSHGFKDATTDPAQIRHWWTSSPAANVGIATGASGLVVVDKDVKHGDDGIEAWRGLRAELGITDDTPQQTTPSGGEHVLYQANDIPIRNSAGALAPGLDVRADGGYIVVAPSRTRDGEYRWAVGYSPDECPLMPLPKVLAERLATRPASPEHAQSGEGRIPKGQQHDYLVRLAGTMLRKAMTPAAILAALLVENRDHLEEPAPESHIQRIVDSVCTLYTPATDPTTNGRTPKANKANKTTSRIGPVLLCMADVTPRAVRWLWPSRIPLGKLTIIDGDPGLGKSLMTLDLAARTSIDAAMPDGTRGDVSGPAGVVLLTAEDDPEDTIKPRLLAAGADCKRIVMLEAIDEVETSSDGSEKTSRRLPTLDDVEAIGEAIRRVDAVLVVVDPVMAYLAGADSHVDADVRRVLVALAALAQRTGVAIVVVRHLNKSGGGNPLYRGGGSIGFIASARSGLLVAPDPADSTGRRRIVAATKSNLSELPCALAYQVGQTETSIYVDWLGQSDQTAKTLLAEPEPIEDDDSSLGEAKDFLRTLLADGPIDARTVQREAREAGISEPTLRRAKPSVGATTTRVGGLGSRGRWEWSMPNSKRTDDPNMIRKEGKMTGSQNLITLSMLAGNEHVRQQGRLPTICPRCQAEMEMTGEIEDDQLRWRCPKCAVVIWLPGATT